MNKDSLKKADPQIAELVEAEIVRQREGLEMIPSENHTSGAVLAALGSRLTDKYSEGYPGKRHYGGNVYVDKVENLAIERAKELFRVPHANIQPYSGSPANTAVYLAVCELGDTVMGLDLPDGGHLTHAWKANVSGIHYQRVPYHVDENGYLDIEEIRTLAKERKPKLIWCGATAYVREFPFEELGKIADEVGAYLASDIAHIAGLVIAKAHRDPVPYAHIVTTTTHKTLRGPRGAMIMVTDKGLQKDPDLAKKIDEAVFPRGVQGGPHNHQTAAIAVALKEASTLEFAEYGKQIVKNAKALAQELVNQGVKLVSGGTDNHMMLIDLTQHGKGGGIFVQEALEAAGITVNKNMIPKDPSSPFYPSGVRLGTPALTSRGMKEGEMKKVASWIVRAIEEAKSYQLPEDKEERREYRRAAKKEIKEKESLKRIRQEVIEFSKQFPIPD
tara:strand:+ start:8068 stop:9402 length:1335 start_codon:yes stop_codon:yes gene_type:complete